MSLYIYLPPTACKVYTHRRLNQSSTHAMMIVIFPPKIIQVRNIKEVPICTSRSTGQDAKARRHRMENYIVTTCPRKVPFPHTQPPLLPSFYRPRLPLLLSKYAPLELLGLVGVCNGDCSRGCMPILISPMRLRSACNAIRTSEPGSRLSNSTPKG